MTTHQLPLTFSLQLLPLTIVHVLNLICSYDFNLGLKDNLGLGVTAVAKMTYTSYVLDVACVFSLAKTASVSLHLLPLTLGYLLTLA